MRERETGEISDSHSGINREVSAGDAERAPVEAGAKDRAPTIQDVYSLIRLKDLTTTQR